MRRATKTSEEGFTIIELLAVIVILGILAAIAVPLTRTVIDESRTRAFLSNALSMKEAASLDMRAQFIAQQDGEDKLYYANLVGDGFLDPFKDPDTSEIMPSDGNGSYVEIDFKEGIVTYSVFLSGQKRRIGEVDSPVPIEQVTLDNAKQIMHTN